VHELSDEELQKMYPHPSRLDGDSTAGSALS
jgi:hypothetical protein